MENDELKPCPFCRSDGDSLSVEYVQESDTHYVLCKKCWAHGPDVDEVNVFDEAAKTLAVDRWNNALR